MLTGHVLLTVIAIRGTLSMEDLVTDFMCEPAEMDDWLGTAATSHSGHFSQAHDPGGLVGSSQGMGFFDRGDTGQGPTSQRGGKSFSNRSCHTYGPLGSCWRQLQDDAWLWILAVA